MRSARALLIGLLVAVASAACPGPRDHAVQMLGPDGGRPNDARPQDTQPDRQPDQPTADSSAPDPDAMTGTPADMTPVGDTGPAGCGTACEHGCNAVRLECNTCKPNQRTCAGSAVVVCNGEGSGTTMMACPSGCNTTTNECNGCAPSTRWCSGNILRECSGGGMPMDRQTCTQGCNATRLECNACNPSSGPTCSGSSVRTCRSDGSGTMDTSCANGCSSGRCNECTPNERQCSGTTLRTCSGSGTWSDMRCPEPVGGTATCSSSMCGFTCGGGVAACNNNTACPKLSWDFEDGLEGVTISAMHTAAAVSNLRTATFLSSRALALDVVAPAASSDFAIRIPFCMGQVANLRGKRLSLRFWLEGDPTSPDAYAWIIHDTAGNSDPYTGLDDPLVREWRVVDVSLARAPGLDEMTQAVILYVYTGGLRSGLPPDDGIWRGTLYVDEIKVQ